MMPAVHDQLLVEFNRAIIEYRNNYYQLINNTNRRHPICSLAVQIYRRYLSRTSGCCHAQMVPSTVDAVRRSITIALSSRPIVEPTIDLFDQCQIDVMTYLSSGNRSNGTNCCCCSCRCVSTPCWSSSSPSSGTNRKSTERINRTIDLDQFAGSLSSSTIEEEDDGASSSSDSAFCSASSNYINTDQQHEYVNNYYNGEMNNHKQLSLSDDHQSIEGRRIYVDDLCARLEMFTSLASQLQMIDKGAQLEHNYIRDDACLYQPTIKIGYCIEEDGNNGHCRPPYVKQILSTNTLTFGQFKRHFSLRHDNNVQFYFKHQSMDPYTRYELLLIVDDHTILPIFDGQIMAVVKSN